MTRQQLLHEASSLSPQEREKLAEELLLTLSETDAEAIDAAWLEEVKARDASEEPSDSRPRKLLEDLRQSFDADELSPELLAELRRRVDAMDRGEMEMIPSEQVMEDLRKQFAH